MAAIIEIPVLLAPIPDGPPTGQDLRATSSYDSLYYQIKEARNLARNIERQLDQEATNTAPDAQWHKVITLAVEILAHHSKDLEICAWLIEALVRRFGFAGLCDGFHLTRELIEQYWEQLYPLEDEEGPISKVAALIGLNGGDSEGTLINPIANIVLTCSKSLGNIALWQYRRACEVDKITDQDKKAKILTEVTVSLKDIEAIAANTTREFFSDLLGNIQGSLKEFDELTNILDKKCAPEIPATSRIHNILKECLEVVINLSKDKLKQDTTILQLNEDNQAAEAGSLDEQPLITGNVTTRVQAFNTLAKIADFFQQTEPHSPISYLIRKAIRWGKLPLSELISELIVDTRLRGELFTLIGIEQQEVEQK